MTPPPLRRPHRRAAAGSVAALLAAAGALAGCATPVTGGTGGPSLAPSGSVGYVACPGAITPVELGTSTPEPTIPLGLSGAPALGDFAVAAAPSGGEAYVVTGDGSPAAAGAGASPSDGPGTRDVIVPVNLADQRAGRPIPLPSSGATHAVAVLGEAGPVLAGVGSAVVPVDPATRRVGTPIRLGDGRTVFGLAVAPRGATVYALVAGGVVPLDPATGRIGAEIATGLSISSVSSPHGIAVSADGTTVYVVGQGGANYGGRLLAIDATTRRPVAEASFDRYGIADPAALALGADGAVLVADAANNWLRVVPPTGFADPPPPVPLPPRTGGTVTTGSRHPTDIAAQPGTPRAFVVDGGDSVLAYDTATRAFGAPVAVCQGASSMVVAPAPGS